MSYKLPKLSDAYEFEKMCRDVLNEEYKNQGIDFRVRGRSGQPQNGIDLFSNQYVDDGTKRIVAQCKNYTDAKDVVKAVSDAIDTDIKKMSGLRYGVKLLYVMTSADYDIKLQDYIDDLNKKVDFDVDIRFWGDIEEAVFYNDELLDKYYPEYSRTKVKETVVHEYTDRRLDKSNVKDYYDDMVRIWEEEPGVERIIGKESLLNAYIESKCVVNGERIPILTKIQSLFVEKYKRVILLHGQPGHGKTTFCQFAIYQYVKRKALNDYKNVFRFSLNPSHSKIIEDKKVILQNALCFDKNGPCITLEECRDSLIFLDGYDELKTQAGATDITNITKLVEVVEPFAKKYNIHFVITSRTVAVKDNLKDTSMQSIPVLEFVDLSEDEQKAWIQSEKRHKSERESLNDYWENTLKNVFTDRGNTIDKKKTYDSLRKLLGIPIIFRMVVHKRYANARNANNKAKLYEELFDLTLDHRLGIDDCIEDKKVAYQKLAYEIFMHNEDTAVLKSSDDAKKELMYYYYLSEKENADSLKMEIGFIHRSFYQYFFADFLYHKLMKATTDEQAERFLGCLGSRIIDDDIRDFFRQISDNYPKNLKLIMQCSNRVIEVLAKTSGIVEENGRIYKEEGSDAAEIPLTRSNYVFVNAVNLCIYFDINRTFNENKNLQLLLKTYDCQSIILSKHHREDEKNQIDLSKVDLRAADLKGAYLSKVNLSFSNLTRVDLNSTILNKTNLSRANLKFANLINADLRRVNLESADLNRANLNSANLLCAIMNRANLVSANLESANLAYAELTTANLCCADLNRANLNNANLSYANLINTNLSETNFRNADLNSAHLTSTNFDRVWGYIQQTFPIPSLAFAKFNYIYVDGNKYSRKEFFAQFQPEVEDHMG